MGTDDGKVGHFVFSLDTELAWGGLWSQSPSSTASRDGAVERAHIQRLLDMLDEFAIAATWAVTGHLFYAKCEDCDSCPVLILKGQDNRFDEIWGASGSMWYGADVVDALLSRGSSHEIGFHGYTHRLFNQLTEEEARFEIAEWLRLATRRGIRHYSVVFPQGRIDHLRLFRDAGFICYRGKEVRHPILMVPLLGKVLNRINLKLAMLTPQVFEAKVDASGLVNIPSSQWLFRTHRAVENVLDSLNLATLRFRPAIKSIDRAAQQSKVVHLWLHPQELRTDKDFDKLRFVFERVAVHVKAGRLQSITMADLAQRTLRSAITNFGVGEVPTLDRGGTVARSSAGFAR
jgi:peptidoglycan/xylan/chitin deacetylase (PgdA/CDA1 family)